MGLTLHLECLNVPMIPKILLILFSINGDQKGKHWSNEIPIKVILDQFIENTTRQVVVKVLVTVTVYALFMWDAHCQDGEFVDNQKIP